MDYVTVEKLRVRGIHGCHKYERTDAQDFLVSVSVGTDLRPSGESDALKDTIDFDFLKACIDEPFAKERHYLIEALAEEIAAAILSDARAIEVTVSIQKPEVWEVGMPGVTITRKR